MKLEEDFDKLINILYDEKLLQSKKIPTTELLLFSKEKYGINWTVEEINLIVDSLMRDGYIDREKVDFQKELKTPSFFLTPKGIQLKLNGGFVKRRRNKKLYNNTILYGSIIASIGGAITIYEFMNKKSKNIEPIIITNDKKNERENESKEKSSLSKINKNNNTLDSISKPINKSKPKSH